ncbi:MAG: hypothetical protein IKP65_02990, partial [Alphaproteobacteria bacterium]|nr:hypothetical protein [Alphaproteobacteria bacterium]
MSPAGDIIFYPVDLIIILLYDLADKIIKGFFSMKKVVITGMGIVSPVGTGIDYAWKNLLAGKSGIRKVTEFDVSDIAAQIAGVPVCGTNPGEYNPDAVIDVREQRKMEKTSMYALVAANEAIKDAGLVDYDGDKTR